LRNQLEKPIVKDKSGKTLPLMEEFYSIQGEGFHTGKAAYFIRVGGCDVGCHWCDVKESWDEKIHPLIHVDEIVNNALKYPARTVVVTGGEPSIYPMDYLTQQLKEKGFQTHIETSGAYPLTGKWDWICLSPKKTMPPLEEIYDRANELKVIIHNKHDLIWAEQQASKIKRDIEFYLQPEWSKIKEMMPLIVNYVMEHPKWNISLQTHKYMNIP